MVINLDAMNPEEVNSYFHKVRAIIFDSSGKLYLSMMKGTFTLPGGGVEENETLEEAIKRELKEELGIDVSTDELQYIGNYQFYHKNFPDFKGRTNRLNEIDLFYVIKEKAFSLEACQFTELEKDQNLKIIAIELSEIEGLLNIKNNNPYKKALDEELIFFIKIVEEIIKNVR